MIVLAGARGRGHPDPAMIKLTIAALLSIASPVFACPLEGQDATPRTADKAKPDSKETAKADKAKDTKAAPAKDAKPTPAKPGDKVSQR